MVFYYKLRQQQSPVQPQGWSLLLKKPVRVFPLRSEGVQGNAQQVTFCYFFHPEKEDCLEHNKNTRAFFSVQSASTCKAERGMTRQRWGNFFITLNDACRSDDNNTYEHLITDLLIGSSERDWGQSSAASRWKKCLSVSLSVYSQGPFFLSKLKLAELICRHFRDKTTKTYFWRLPNLLIVCTIHS